MKVAVERELGQWKSGDAEVTTFALATINKRTFFFRVTTGVLQNTDIGNPFDTSIYPFDAIIIKLVVKNQLHNKHITRGW